MALIWVILTCLIGFLGHRAWKLLDYDCVRLMFTLTHAKILTKYSLMPGSLRLMAVNHHQG
jgi:hypothetical protein